MEGGARSEAARGYLYALLGAMCGGITPTLIKALLRNNQPPVVMGFGYVLSGAILLLYHPRMKPARGSVSYLLFFGLVGAALAPLMYVVGLSETTAVNASLLANGEVLFTAIIAFSLFGETLTRSQGTRALLIVAGLVVVSTNLDLAHVQFLQGLAGNLLILGSTVGWSVENNILAAVSRRFDVSGLSKFRNLIGGGVVSAFVFAAGVPFGFSGSDVALLIFLGLALAGMTYLFIAAVKRLGAVKMLLVWSTSTVFGAFFALVFLGEQVTPAQLAGGAMILLGVYLFRRSERPASPM